MSIGPAEIMVVLVVALMVVGPARLPVIARKLGGAMTELRSLQATFTSGIDGVVRGHLDPDETSSSPPKPAPLTSESPTPEPALVSDSE